MFGLFRKKVVTKPLDIFSFDNTKYDNFLDDPSSIAGRKISNFILLLTILFVFSLSLETVGDNARMFAKHFFFIDALISIIFAGEYFYRFYRAKRKSAFVVNPFNIVDLISFTPFFIELIFGHMMHIHLLTALRVMRIFRLIDFVKKTPLIVEFLKSIGKYRNEYYSILTFAGVILVIVSFIVYYFEHGLNPMFSSLPNTFRWALVTMSTVGYGDIYPITPLGKIFGMILVLLGPVIVTATASITVIIFMNISRLEKGDEVSLDEANKCWNCKHPNLISAKYCMDCGVELSKKKRRRKLFT